MKNNLKPVFLNKKYCFVSKYVIELLSFNASRMNRKIVFVTAHSPNQSRVRPLPSSFDDTHHAAGC